MRKLFVLLLTAFLITGCGANKDQKNQLSYNKLIKEYNSQLSDSFIPVSPLKLYHSANAKLKYLDKVSEKRKNNVLDGIIAEYKEAIKLDPTFSPAYYSLGLAYLKDKKKKEAIEAFENALAFNPECIQYKVALAKACYDSKMHGCASTHFSDALIIDPKNIDAIIGLAVIELQKENYVSAVELYEQVLKINPENKLAKAAIKKFSKKANKQKKALNKPCHKEKSE